MINEPAPLKDSSGFTLVELMITVLIVGVLLGIGLPSFRSFIVDQRYRATSADLRLALMMARSEAVKRNAAIQVTPKTANDWTSGWEIIDPATGTADILNHELSEVNNIALSGPSAARFLPSGRVATAIEFDLTVGAGQFSKTGCLRIETGGYASNEGCTP
ncbi:MAG: prepilin-type N-terminal cleavage/methylation domain-containing protein [Halieaceae bacterium]|nr:prepilin-type N-terminal cleavage/methylation domain-containing protein [Halieaceae bacterium]